MAREKRARKRVPKEDKKNLRGWAQGAREEVLTPHLDAYAAAVDSGWKSERSYLKKVCLEFHTRVDWRTADHEEPVLKPWNPKEKRVVEELTADEEGLKRARINELDARIRRWYKYRIRRLRKQGRLASSLDPTKNPYAVLLANLSGISAPPKARQGYQQWMRDCYTEKIAAEVTKQWEEGRDARLAQGETRKEPKAGFRAEVARTMYKALPVSERTEIEGRAKQEAAAAKAAYLKALKAPPAQDAASRYSCIKSVSEFLGPILQGLHAHTGLHATVLLGGPMPQFGGDVRTIHVSYGRNKATLGQHWPQWDKPRFAKDVLGFFTEYLNTAFDAEDCKRAALATADLAGAKYTIPAEGESSDSDSDSDSDDGHSDDDSEDERPRKKARVVGRLATSSTTSARAPSTQPPASPPASPPAWPRESPAPASPSAPALPPQEESAELRALKERHAAEEKLLEEKLLDEAQRGAKAGAPAERPRPKPRKKKSTPQGAEGLPRRFSRRVAGDVEMEDPSTTDTPAAAPASTPVPETSTASTTGITAPSSTTPTPDTTTTAAGGAMGAGASSAAEADANTWVGARQTVERAALMPCPAKAPDWFVNVRGTLIGRDLGCHFDALIAAWTRIEDASRFEHADTNLPSKGRPAEVTTWVRGRRVAPPPTAANVELFARQWGAWWESLQPQWRQRDSLTGRWVMGGDDGGGREWGPLYQWGVNGTVSLLAGLYSWGCAVVDKGDLDIAWEEAVSDVTWMLEGMAKYYEKFNRKF